MKLLTITPLGKLKPQVDWKFNQFSRKHQQVVT